MGELAAEGYAEAADESVDLTALLTAHLLTNHYPPLPQEYVAVAEAALAKAQEAGPTRDGFDAPEVLEERVEWPTPRV